MENKIIVTTQAELDAIPLDFKGEIRITGKINRICNNYPNVLVYVSDSATVNYVSGSATVNYVSGSATVNYVYGSATVNYVYGSATVKNVYGSATVKNVYGSACVLFAKGSSTIETRGRGIVSYERGSKVKLSCSPKTTIVILDPFYATFEAFQENYPVDVTDGVAILYKAVRKTPEGKYIASKNNYEYIVGNVHTHECDQQKQESCSFGLHVSHLDWALKFGAGWDNLAIIECAVPIDKIVVCFDCDGKVRTSELQVIREVPKEDWI
jgi:hypothetical protein